MYGLVGGGIVLLGAVLFGQRLDRRKLLGIAAVIIGGTVLKGGFGRVWGTVIGVLILTLIGNLLNLTDFVSPYLNGAIQGAIIVLAVVLQREGKART